MTRATLADFQKHFSEDVRQLNASLFVGIDMAAPGALDTTVVSVHDVEQLKEQLEATKKGNKYGARKTRIGNLTFDSAKEAARYLVLRYQLERGIISNLVIQHRITLLDDFLYEGKKVQGIHYTADFCYLDDGLTYIEDVKSIATAKTEAFRIRWRLLQWHFRDRPDVKLIMT